MRIAIIQAHVVVGTGETIDDGVVVLDGDRIENVSAEESASGHSYDLTVGLEGRALIPGDDRRPHSHGRAATRASASTASRWSCD
jgi:hypothetical protein